MTALLSSFRLMLILCLRSIGIVSPNGYDVCIIVKCVKRNGWKIGNENVKYCRYCMYIREFNFHHFGSLEGDIENYESIHCSSYKKCYADCVSNSIAQ